MSLSGLLLHQFRRGSDITACAQTKTNTRFMFLCLLINTTNTAIVATDGTATRPLHALHPNLCLSVCDQSWPNTTNTAMRKWTHTHTHEGNALIFTEVWAERSPKHRELEMLTPHKLLILHKSEMQHQFCSHLMSLYFQSFIYPGKKSLWD